MTKRKRKAGLRSRATSALETGLSGLVILLPLWVILCLLVATMAPTVWRVLEASGVLGVRLDARWYGPRDAGPGSLAPLFTRQVRHWGADIDRWALARGMNPNFVATVMQIESCGNPLAVSPSGAAGLFQVMPFHFAEGDDFFAPETNAARGLDYLAGCLGRANGDAGRALACYNGGPGLLSAVYTAWPAETQRFYTWGTGIYADALVGRAGSEMLNQWLAAGGASLCQRAAGVLGVE